MTQAEMHGTFLLFATDLYFILNQTVVWCLKIDPCKWDWFVVMVHGLRDIVLF